MGERWGTLDNPVGGILVEGILAEDGLLVGSLAGGVLLGDSPVVDGLLVGILAVGGLVEGILVGDSPAEDILEGRPEKTIGL